MAPDSPFMDTRSSRPSPRRADGSCGTERRGSPVLKQLQMNRALILVLQYLLLIRSLSFVEYLIIIIIDYIYVAPFKRPKADYLLSNLRLNAY